MLHLEGMYDYHLVQLPDRFRADQKLKHVVKGIVQMPLKHWQAWGIDHLSMKPVPEFDTPLGKEMLLNALSKPPLAQLWTIPTHPITGSQEEELSTSLSPPQEAVESAEVAPQPPLLQASQAQSSQPLLTGHFFQPFHQLCFLPLVWVTLHPP